MTFVTTKSLNIEAIPCKIALGSFPSLIRRLHIFRIEFGSLLIKDSVKVISVSSDTAPIRLMILPLH